MMDTTCPHCGANLSLRSEQLILARRFPCGDGSLVYYCHRCRNPIVLYLDFDAVMSAVFAGVKPVDERIATPGN